MGFLFRDGGPLVGGARLEVLNTIVKQIQNREVVSKSVVEEGWAWCCIVSVLSCVLVEFVGLSRRCICEVTKAIEYATKVSSNL